MFLYHAPRIIEENNLKAIRLGHKLSAQYNDARTGQASQLTHGVIEIVDIDGWVPKVGIAVQINGKIERTTIKVIIAASRLTGAILGYEFALKGEDSESFRRCIASIYLSKQERATALGLGQMKGLLVGSIDGVFVDNGAGASEKVVSVAVDEMGLIRILAPPGRGDTKGVIEGLNSLLIRMMAEERIGATRDRDALASEIRQLMRQAPPISLDDFERFMLKAFNHYNLYTNKRRLRTRTMRDAGVGIYPAALHKYTQERRHGDAAKKYTPSEVNDRFIPWISKACRKGVVYINNVRFSSTTMEDYFDERAKRPGKVTNPRVWVKRLTGFDQVLLWRKDDAKTEALEMVEEDRLSFGTVSWKQIELDLLDDDHRGKKLEDKGRRNRGKVSVKTHEQITAAERGRGNPLAGMSGATVVAAKDTAALKRAQERGAAETSAYDVQFPQVAVEGVSYTPQRRGPAGSDEEYLKELGLL